jgi:large subunit ribosomal protein L46
MTCVFEQSTLILPILCLYLSEKYLPRGFTPAPRETEADHNGDVRTLDRRLKTRVYLTIKDSLSTPEGDKDMWQLPTVQVLEDETLLDAAKRAVREKVGAALEIYCPSNCPMAVETRVFKEEERCKHINTFGIKTFFMVVQYDDGKVTMEDLLGASDFAWLEKPEVVDRIREEQGERQSKLYQYLLVE